MWFPVALGLSQDFRKRQTLRRTTVETGELPAACPRTPYAGAGRSFPPVLAARPEPDIHEHPEAQRCQDSPALASSSVSPLGL